MNEPSVSVTIKNQIAYLTLNRAGKRNALDMAMFKALDQTSAELRKNHDIRAVIVQGAGKDFCSGLDVKSMMSKKTTILKLLFKWLPGNANLAQRVSLNWRKLPVPVIMVIHGRCWGGGLQIALGADFRFTTPDASLSVMEGRWGLIPDMAGNIALRELLAKDVALRLSMTAEVIDAQDALELGLITAISETPLKMAEELVESLRQRSPDALAAVKKLYHQNWFRPDWRMLAKESYYQVRIILGKNQARAVKRQLQPEKAPTFLKRMKW